MNLISLTPTISESLQGRGISLREMVAEDYDFLARLYITNRWPEMVNSGWTNEQKAGFLYQQFQFQTIHYEKFYHEALKLIVMQNNSAIGRLYLIQMPNNLRVVDITLSHECRNQGIGSELLRSVFLVAEKNNSIVSINVELFNPAQNLYRRLGFMDQEREGVYISMVRPLANSC